MIATRRWNLGIVLFAGLAVGCADVLDETNSDVSSTDVPADVAAGGEVEK